MLELLRAEFSDIGDTEQLGRVALRLLMAALLGGLIGLEREAHGKAAGLRTHMLVSLGAAMFVLVPQQAGASQEDLSRVIQGVVSGIGFLGVGMIVSGPSLRRVKGLTTAAGIWLTAAVGIACGLGRESTAVLATLLAVVILALLPAVERRIDDPAPPPPAAP